MANDRKRRAGFLVLSHGYLVGYVLSNAFVVWLSAGLSEAITQEAGVQTVCQKLSMVPARPGEYNQRECRYEYLVRFPSFSWDPHGWFYMLAPDNLQHHTPPWNARRWLYEITHDRRFLEVIEVNITDPGKQMWMGEADWEDLFASFQFARMIRINSATFSDGAMRGLVRNRKLEELCLGNSPCIEGREPGPRSHRQIPVTGDGLSHLKGLPRFRELALINIHLNEAGRRTLGSLTQLELLTLYHRGDATGNYAVDREGDATLAHLTGLKNLKFLRLGGSEFTDAGLVYVGKMRSLKRLHLGGGLGGAQIPLSDGGLRHLEGLSQLEDLRVEETGVTDRGIEHIARLANLKFLDLSRTQVTDAGLPALQKLKNLRDLYLCSTPATGPAIRKLVEAMPRVEAIWIVRERTDDSSAEYGIATGKAHAE